MHLQQFHLHGFGDSSSVASVEIQINCSLESHFATLSRRFSRVYSLVSSKKSDTTRFSKHFEGCSFILRYRTGQCQKRQMLRYH
mmetsp:Transcript_18743/g.46551  ORF Transcript_18743/g.46551 Transcript_18743/m.46551 type:complete len:84 (+) Transcript_18743:603-854(+)